MDRRTALIVAVGLLVVVGALYAHLAVVATSRPSATSGEDASPPAPVDRGLAARLDRIEHGIQRLTEDLAALRAERAKATASTQAGADGTDFYAQPTLKGIYGAGMSVGSDGPVAADAPKDDPYPALSNEDLRLEATSLGANNKDPAGAVLRWKALLARKLTAEEKSDVLLQLGYAYFGLNNSAKSEESLRAVVDADGGESENGTEARRMLGWTLMQKKDYRGALDVAQGLARDRNAAAWKVANARYVAVLSLVELKDDAAARREIDAFVSDYGNDAEKKWMIDGAKQKLEGMK